MVVVDVYAWRGGFRWVADAVDRVVGVVVVAVDVDGAYCRGGIVEELTPEVVDPVVECCNLGVTSSAFPELVDQRGA